MEGQKEAADANCVSGGGTKESSTAGADAARSHAEDGAAPAGHPPLVIRGKSCRSSLDASTRQQVFLAEDARGEWVQISGRNAAAHAYATITDWLNVTFPFEGTQQAVERLLGRFGAVLGRKFFPALELRQGKHNYERGEGLKAFFCFGGQHQRGTALLSLSGGACAVIIDWPALVALGRDALQGTGRTVTIGIREHGKRLSVYEKGMGLGCPGHPWVRWELSLGNKGRVIPWEVLLEPGRYVVGAYPKALGWVQEEMSRIRTLQKQTQISYEAAVAHARKQFGPTLNLVLKVEGSAEKAVDKLRRDGLPKRVRHPAVEDPEGWIE